MPKYKVRVVITSTVTVEAESPEHAWERVGDLDVQVPSYFADVMTTELDELCVHEAVVRVE